ncbi:MAG: hypothetical protein OIF38_12420, partial [Cellvibrionaceae bacterium]|nr:hypothetical protein [Cellvibrionaceae bacterium]
GNQIIWVAAPSDRDRELLGALAASRLPAEQLQLLEPAALGAALAHPALAGVMAPPNWPALRRRLAQRDGAIIPLLASSSQFFERRLCLEKSVSIDTTAAGGNASLMAMSED